jgi:hypothetical protein
MKLPTILNDSKELLQIGIERIADSSKPAIVVYSYTFAAGMARACSSTWYQKIATPHKPA